MQCTEVRQALKQAGTAELLRCDGELRAHLDGCADCRAAATDLQYRALLGKLPVPAPGAGYTDRALAQAWAAGKGRQRVAYAIRPAWGLATAAVLVLAFALLLRDTLPTRSVVPEQASGAAAVVVAVAPNTVHQVDLLMVSARELTAATITLQLDGNVVLAGYPGRSSLTWPTALAAGNNQLTLPVQLTSEQSGVITVAVESGGARKEMMFTVQATGQQDLALLTI